MIHWQVLLGVSPDSMASMHPELRQDPRQPLVWISIDNESPSIHNAAYWLTRIGEADKAEPGAPEEGITLQFLDVSSSDLEPVLISASAAENNRLPPANVSQDGA